MKLMDDIDFRATLCTLLVLGYSVGTLVGIDVSNLRDLTLAAVMFYFANKSTLDQANKE